MHKKHKTHDGKARETLENSFDDQDGKKSERGRFQKQHKGLREKEVKPSDVNENGDKQCNIKAHKKRKHKNRDGLEECKDLSPIDTEKHNE